MKKILKLISGVVQAVMAALLFVPISLWKGMYTKNVVDLYNYYQGNTTEYPGYELLGEYKSISFFHRVTGMVTDDYLDKGLLLLFYILLALLIIGLVWVILQLVTKIKQYKLVTLSIAVFQTVVLVIFLIRSLEMLITDSLSFYFEFSPNVGFYVLSSLMIVNVVTTVVALVKKKDSDPVALEPLDDEDQIEQEDVTIEDTPSTPEIQEVNEVSKADELKKYKDLLDDGIITQEEFDAKKKQLLGI